LTLRTCVEEKVLVRSDRPQRGGLRQSGIRAGSGVLFIQVVERSRYTMPPRRERQSPDREDRDARRRGRPAGNPEIERQMRDLRARLEEMETAQRRGVAQGSSVIPRSKRKLDTKPKRSQQRMHQQRG
jgi:hypothetical protein